MFLTIALSVLIDAQTVTSSASGSLRDVRLLMPSICIAVEVMCSCLGGIHGHAIRKGPSCSALSD